MKFQWLTHRAIARSLSAAAAFALAGVLGGCGLESSNKYVVKDCILPDDQAGTISGRWKATAVPIAFHQGDFSSEEQKEIIAAADTWNSFYAASLGMAALDYGDAGSPRVATGAKPAAPGAISIIDSNSQFKAAVVIYKTSVWTEAAAAMAVTWYYTRKVGPRPYPMYNALIELNYQNFFSAGKKRPDLQSIMLHEFGHLMGIDHSCESTGKTGVPTCSARGLNSAYLSASMFPSFGFDAAGFGEQRRELNDNDQGRANCPYIGATPR